MENQVNKVAMVEAMLFSFGDFVNCNQIKMVADLTDDELKEIIVKLKEKYEKEDSGIDLVIAEDKLKLVSKEQFYEYIYPILNGYVKPKLTNALIETLSIIAYNPRITRAEIEAIRGVNNDANMHKLIDYGLIVPDGKSELPGRPMTYKVSPLFFEVFGMSSLDELPQLPPFDLNSNAQLKIENMDG